MTRPNPPDAAPNPAPPRGSRPAPPWGLVGMLAVVVLVESAVAHRDIHFTAVWHWDWRIIGRAATRPERVADRDLLIFGDSLMKFGLMPRIVQERSGRTAYNLALHTGQTSSSYFMLQRALDAGARPRAVVLDSTPHMLAHATDINATLWPELLTPAECLDLARAQASPGFFAATMLAEGLPTVKERFEIRAAIGAALAGASRSRAGEIPSYRRNWRVNDGAQLMNDGPAPEVDPVHWSETLYKTWRPDPVNLAYLDRFLALAESRAITVFWVLPPIHPAVLERTRATGFDAAYSAFVRSVRDRYPSVVVLDGRDARFPADHFNDGIHCNRRGALLLSAIVGEALRDHAESGGGPLDHWVALTGDHVGPVDRPIEDVMGSARHLAAEAAGRAGGPAGSSTVRR